MSPLPRGIRRMVIAILVVGMASGCDDRRRGRGQETPEEEGDDDAGDDDAGDDDATDDDDIEWKGDPVLLATYDFTLVMVKNELSGQFAAVHGQMDVSVTATQFLAEMQTSDGQTWDWFGSLTNTTSFDVWGSFVPPGAAEIVVRVAGNFQANAGQVDGSNSCLTGIGKDDDPNLGTEEGRYIEFTWYACRQDASPAAVERTGSYAPAVSVVHWDMCGAWASWPSETWRFEGRKLIVTTARGDTGWGVVSDDGQLFRYTILESEDPGRSIKVLGDFESTTSSQANGHGYCGDGTMAPDARINLNGY